MTDHPELRHWHRVDHPQTLRKSLPLLLAWNPCCVLPDLPVLNANLTAQEIIEQLQPLLSFASYNLDKDKKRANLEAIFYGIDWLTYKAKLCKRCARYNLHCLLPSYGLGYNRACHPCFRPSHHACNWTDSRDRGSP